MAILLAYNSEFDALKFYMRNMVVVLPLLAALVFLLRNHAMSMAENLEYGASSVSRLIKKLKLDLDKFKENSVLKSALEVQIKELKESTNAVKKDLEQEVKAVEKLKAQKVSVQIGDKELATVEEVGRFFRTIGRSLMGVVTTNAVWQEMP